MCGREIKEGLERLSNGEGATRLYLYLLAELWHIQGDLTGKAYILVSDIINLLATDFFFKF